MPWPVTLEFLNQLITFFRQQKRLKPQQALKIIEATRQLLATLPNVLEIEVPDGSELTIVVCSGDSLL